MTPTVLCETFAIDQYLNLHMTPTVLLSMQAVCSDSSWELIRYPILSINQFQYPSRRYGRLSFVWRIINRTKILRTFLRIPCFWNLMFFWWSGLSVDTRPHDTYSDCSGAFEKRSWWKTADNVDLFLECLNFYQTTSLPSTLSEEWKIILLDISIES